MTTEMEPTTNSRKSQEAIFKYISTRGRSQHKKKQKNLDDKFENLVGWKNQECSQNLRPKIGSIYTKKMKKEKKKSELCKTKISSKNVGVHSKASEIVERTHL